MVFFCCGSRTPATPPPLDLPPCPSPATLSHAPKLARRRSAPRSKASQQSIEAFYREGRELYRAEQEELERTRLRAALRDEYERDLEERRFNGEVMSPLTEMTEAISAMSSDLQLPPAAKEMPFQGIDPNPITRAASFENFNLPESNSSLGGSSPEDSFIKQEKDNFPLESTDFDSSPGRPSSIMPTPEPMKHYPFATITTTSINQTTKTIEIPERDSLRHSSPQLSDAMDRRACTPKNRGENIVDSHVRKAQSEGHMALAARPAQGVEPDTVEEAEKLAEDEMVKGVPVDPYQDDLFARIASLVKPSTSTFVSFTSTSQVNLANSNNPESPEEKTPTRRRASGGSLSKTKIPKRPSSVSIMKQKITIESTSSFYPSLAGSQIGSEISVGIDRQDTPMQVHYRRASLEKAQRTVSLPQPILTQEQAKFSQFKFPWNSTASLVSAEIGSPLVRQHSRTETLEARTSKPDLRGRPLKRGSELRRRGSSRVTVVKTEVGYTRSERSVSRASVRGTGQQVTIVKEQSTPEKQTGVSRKMSWRSNTTPKKRVSSIPVLDTRNSSKSYSMGVFDGERVSTIEKLATIPTDFILDVPLVDEEQESRFAPIAKRQSLVRSKSMSLKKTLSTSMARIRGRVSVAALRRTSAIHVPPAAITNDVVENKSQLSSNSRLDEVVFKPTLPRELLKLSESDSSHNASLTGASRNASYSGASSPKDAAHLHRSNTARSLPPQGIARRQPSQRLAFKKRDAEQNDNEVIFPFADGEDSDREEGGRISRESVYLPSLNSWDGKQSAGEFERRVREGMIRAKTVGGERRRASVPVVAV